MKKSLFLSLPLLWALISFISAPKQRVFLIGDSTMAPKKSIDRPETGWGEAFVDLFTQAVTIENHAVNGRSTRSFRTLGHWKKVLDALQPGDIVLIQFGHNDAKESDTARYAAPQTDYRQNLNRYIDEIESKNAQAILVTPVMRRNFNDQGQLVDGHGDYPKVVRSIAVSRNIPLVDLHATSSEWLQKEGSEATKRVFMHYPGGIFPKFPQGIEDNTHFSPYGAEIMAKLVAKELVRLGHPLRNFLKPSPYPQHGLYQLPTVYAPVFRQDTFLITRYGAVGNGTRLATSAIQQAIDEAHRAGGGVVLIPAGLWLTGPITIKSHVNVHAQAGALIQFTPNQQAYPIVETTWEGQTAYRCQAPISAVGQVNIAITGPGIWDGSGDVWKPVKKSKLTGSQWSSYVKQGGVVNKKGDMWYPSESSRLGHEEANNWAGKLDAGKSKEDQELIRDFLRPNMVSFTRCQGILIEDVTFQNSPAWTLHPLLSQHITLRRVQVKNPWYGQNNDALDLESCQYGLVEGCRFDTGDDAITLKSGRDAQGRARGVATAHMLFRDNVVFHGHGGFVIGSEMSGGVHDIFITNSQFLGTDIGLRFKTTRGRGGEVARIYISDIFMNQIPGEALLFDMYYAAKDPIPLEGEKYEEPTREVRPVDETTPVFRDFYLERIYAYGAKTAIRMTGIPEMPVRNIRIKDAAFESKEGIQLTEVEGIYLDQIQLSNPTIDLYEAREVHFQQIKTQLAQPTRLIIRGKESKRIHWIGNTKPKVEGPQASVLIFKKSN